MKPKRIQRKRTKGWRMPSNAVYVGRPTKWGNPFKLMNDNLIHCDASHRRKILTPWVIFDNDNLWLGNTGLEEVVRLYRMWLYDHLTHPLSPQFNKLSPPRKFYAHDPANELRGKDLACWCSIMDKNGNYTPCHADVLLEIANS